jgi:hypothetical protein
MTDRLKGCTVIFDHDIRVDDAEALLNAIRMIKGVQSVEPSISTSEDWMAARKAKTDMINAFQTWLNEQWDKR